MFILILKRGNKYHLGFLVRNGLKKRCKICYPRCTKITIAKQVTYTPLADQLDHLKSRFVSHKLLVRIKLLIKEAINLQSKWEVYIFIWFVPKTLRQDSKEVISIVHVYYGENAVIARSREKRYSPFETISKILNFTQVPALQWLSNSGLTSLPWFHISRGYWRNIWGDKRYGVHGLSQNPVLPQCPHHHFMGSVPFRRKIIRLSCHPNP
jgi:hypothetical protein